MFSKNAVICYNLDTEENMNKQGFTLTELLITVVIVGILVSIALPMYTRTIERSRATEAMAAIKAMNDSIYAFFIEREACPTRFSQLAITVEDANDADNADNTIETKFFRFDLAGSPVSVPGTDCNGILATRIHGGNYQYEIWNPYTRGTTGNSLALQCAPVEGINGAALEKSRAVCESLGLFREENLGATGGSGTTGSFSGKTGKTGPVEKIVYEGTIQEKNTSVDETKKTVK